MEKIYENIMFEDKDYLILLMYGQGVKIKIMYYFWLHLL